ncbi:MAG: hypothetical protein ACHP7A_00690 [Caulobacterales bacterium]
MQGELDPMAWSLVVAALLDGRLRILARRSGKGPALRDALIEQSQLESLLRRRAPSGLPEASISCRAAAAILGVHVGLIRAAIAAGLIEGQQRNANRIDISLRSLGRFNSQYITHGEIGRRAACSAVAFVATIQDRGTKAIMLGQRHRVWPRARVESLLLN